LGWFLTLLISLSASAHTFEVKHTYLCENQLVGSRGKIYRQIQELNPELNPPVDADFASIYLTLKKEEWKYGAIPIDAPFRLKPIPAELIQHISDRFSNAYSVEVGDLETFTNFYLNALRNIYSRVSRLYKDEFIASVAGPNLSTEQKQMALTFFDLSIAPKRLDDREMSPAMAAGFLREQPWKQINWSKMMTVSNQWIASSPEWTRRAFYRWLAQHPELGLSQDEAEFFGRAVDQAELTNRTLCCVSEPGCVDCPLNRRYRRP
jgi:hypothetical protein